MSKMYRLKLMQVKQVNGRARGASLERGGRRFDEETMRRTKSQFQVDDIPAVVRNQLSERKVLGVSVTTKPSRSMNSLLIDDNQNDLSQDKVDHQGYDYIVPRRSSHANPSTYRSVIPTNTHQLLHCIGSIVIN